MLAYIAVIIKANHYYYYYLSTCFASVKAVKTQKEFQSYPQLVNSAPLFSLTLSLIDFSSHSKQPKILNTSY